MSCLLAVDAGGTSCRAVVLDRTGRCLGYGRGGGGNPISSGPTLAAAAVVAATREALAEAAGVLLAGAAGTDATVSTGTRAGTDAAVEVDSAVIAMAGARTYTSSDWITSELGAIGVTGPVVLESDLLATFCSGGADLDGYAIVAGTGAAAVRVEGGRVVGSADGLGWLLGDAGSGFWIGHQVVIEAVAALDNRAQPTVLTDLLLRELGIVDTPGLTDDGRRVALPATVDRLYDVRPVQLAQFAPLAFEAAAAGDTAAARILAEAEDAIAATLSAVAIDAVSGPAVLGGGVLARMAALPEHITRSHASVSDVRRVDDGTVGAAVLALRAASVEVTSEIFATIVATLARLRAAR